MADYYCIKRDIVERIILLYKIRKEVIEEDHMSDEESNHVFDRDELFVVLELALYNIILPEWRTLSHSGVDVSMLVSDRIQAFLS